MLRNRIHRLLGAQHGLELPQVSDLFGRKGMSFLREAGTARARGPAAQAADRDTQGVASPHQGGRGSAAQEMERTEHRRGTSEPSRHGTDPGGGGRQRDRRHQPLSRARRSSAATPGCVRRTSSSGGKTYNGKLMRHCNKWLRWAFVEAAWVAIGCAPYFGDSTSTSAPVGKKANTAIVCVARRMAASPGNS